MKKFRPIIHADECKGCSRCVDACPKSVLAMGAKINALGLLAVEVADAEACIGCSACFYTCPEPGAINIVFTETDLIK